MIYVNSEVSTVFTNGITVAETGVFNNEIALDSMLLTTTEVQPSNPETEG